MKRKRTKLLVFFVLAGILALFYMTGESYYEGLYGGSSLEEKNDVVCRYKYDMIVDSPNSSFWQMSIRARRRTFLRRAVDRQGR